VGRRLLSALALLLVFGAAVAIGFMVNFIVLSTNTMYYKHSDFGVIIGKHYTVRNDRGMDIKSDNGTALGHGHLGIGLPVSMTSTKCHSGQGSKCMYWPNKARLKVTDSTDGKCYTMSWLSYARDVTEIRDCYSLNGSHWYGGAEVREQYWPIEKWNHKLEMFIAGNSFKNEYGGVLERYWLSSAGFAIVSPVEVPLFVSINASHDGQLCLAGRFEGSMYRNVNNTYPYLTYTICNGNDLKSLHLYMINTFFQKPIDIPDTRMFTHPIWSTWAQFKKEISQSQVLEFARQIRANNFTVSQLEIDDDWTPHYGDLRFNPSKFPDARGMIRQLKSMGFRVTVWVHPFANLLSGAFIQGVEKGYWVKNELGAPGLSIWWDGIGGILDVTNKEAVDWFRDKLRNLTLDYGVDSFKFDAGERNWLPFGFKFHKQYLNPDMYATLYAELAHDADPFVRHQEVRVGAHAQHLPIFVRMMDKDSNWGYVNGLKTIIPDALTFGLLGYPFVLPDMIGGNAYKGALSGKTYPDRELYIRWVELNAFLPSLQFSITPWLYDQEVINICEKMVNLHIKYSPTIISLAREATRTGAPIIRPLWWVAPNDPIAQTIDSEFLLGDDILVAPILDQGATARDIYLPHGLWKDELSNRHLVGGMNYPNFQVNLAQLAYFSRIKD
jgi:hypothetical protein